VAAAGRQRGALVVADGDVPARASLDAAWPDWAAGIDLVVAADGGAIGAERLGFRIDLVVGDGDSLGDADLERLASAGVAVQRSPAEKDESDTQLAVLAAIERGATWIVIVGALGGRRVDHALANVSLLALRALGGRPCSILDETARIRLLTGPGEMDVEGPPGGLVSLLPLGDVDGVTTEGLAYPLNDERLPMGPARGLSNVRTASRSRIAIRSGRLLVVESPATLSP
jgi:thiamine pyrophosphokinase